MIKYILKRGDNVISSIDGFETSNLDKALEVPHTVAHACREFWLKEFGNYYTIESVENFKKQSLIFSGTAPYIICKDVNGNWGHGSTKELAQADYERVMKNA